MPEKDIQLLKDKIPNFIEACESQEAGHILIHQDAYAAGYQPSEYMLLGMAIKYAGLHGKEIHIHGVNRETLKDT